MAPWGWIAVVYSFWLAFLSACQNRQTELTAALQYVVDSPTTLSAEATVLSIRRVVVPVWLNLLQKLQYQLLLRQQI
jgi:hypothetical protein